MTMNELKFIPLFMVPNSIRFQCNTYHFASSVLLVSVFFMVIITRLVLNGLFVVLFFITFIPVPGLQSGNALACSIANQFFFSLLFDRRKQKKTLVSTAKRCWMSFIWQIGNFRLIKKAVKKLLSLNFICSNNAKNTENQKKNCFVYINAICA